MSSEIGQNKGANRPIKLD